MRNLTTHPHLVLVYGSLMSRMHNHPLLDGAVSVGPTLTDETHFSMFSAGGFPMVAGPSTAGDYDNSERAGVVGELYAVSDATLARLDALEHHPHWYRRERVDLDPAFDPSGEGSAWMYVMADAHSIRDTPMVPNGDWRTYCARDQRRARPAATR